MPRRIVYSEQEIEFLRSRRLWNRTKLHAAFVARFNRQDVLLHNIHDLYARNGWKNGRHGMKGIPSPNKGKRLSHNAKPKGSERPMNGYIEVNLGPDVHWRERHVMKHRLLWEAKHGPIPPGMRLKCKGDTMNADPSNWELVSHAVACALIRRGYSHAPEENKPLILAVAKLKDRLRQPIGE